MLKKFILSNEFYEVQLSILEKDDHAHLSVMDSVDSSEGIEVVVDKTDVEQIISLLESSLKSFK